MENSKLKAEAEKPRSHNTNLDFVRGVAALVVVIFHLQCFQFVFADENKVFNFFCSLGGDAVMVFFVLSGYLVGGSVMKGVQNDQWSWPDYLVNRLSRLWMVLIPALLLTVIWDLLGLRLVGPGPYHGSYWNLIAAGPGDDYALDIKTFFGNVFFLQFIKFSRLGSNSPVWSLANEFWYYILFPLLYLFFFQRSKWTYRSFHLVAFIGLIDFLPRKLVHLGVIWAMGAIIYWVIQRPRLNRCVNNIYVFSFSFLMLVGVLVVTHLALIKGDLGRYFSPDCSNERFMVGMSFAGMIPFLVKHRLDIDWYIKISTWLSKISYTLYLVHFPLMAFYFFSFRLPKKDLSMPGSYSLFLFYIGVCLAYAWVIWYLFERRTPEFRKILKNAVHFFTVRA